MAESIQAQRALLGVAAVPSPGQGLALDANGRIPASLVARLPGYEISYTQITSSVNIASTTEATGTTIISPPALLFDGSPVNVEVFSQGVNMPTAAIGNFVVVSLFEGSTQIARLWAHTSESVATQETITMYGRFRFTPAAGLHTYTVTAYATSTTGTPAVLAGAAGTATTPPAFVRFTKA